jgi:hypothetical protein
MTELGNQEKQEVGRWANFTYHQCLISAKRF